MSEHPHEVAANNIRAAREALTYARCDLVNKVLVLISKIILDSARMGFNKVCIRFNYVVGLRLTETEWNQICTVIESTNAKCDWGTDVKSTGAKRWYVVDYADIYDNEPSIGSFDRNFAAEI
jgi:hypothetical protein